MAHRLDCHDRIWPIHWSEVGQLCVAKVCEGEVSKREEPKISRLFFLLPLQISCFSLSTMPTRGPKANFEWISLHGHSEETAQTTTTINR